jgi:hypothetical protein
MDPQRITDYIILKHDEIAGMEADVKNYIAQGYQPYGNLSTILYAQYQLVYVQAMVKYKP